MPFLTHWFGNPSSHHTVGEAAAEALADARARVARVLGLRAGDIVFTSGGTEANNLAVKGIAIAAQLGRGAGHVVTTPIEHESVLESAQYLARVHGFDRDARAGRRRRRGSPPPTSPRALRDDTALVSIGYANNEVGTIQDVAAIAAIARERRIPVHIDAVQAAGWLPLSAAELGVDAISHRRTQGRRAQGHRRAGRPRPDPARAAAARRRAGARSSQRHRGRRGGRRARDGARTRRSRAGRGIRAPDRCCGMPSSRRVLDTVPSARLTGDPVHRLPATASFTFAGTSGEAVLLELERRGIVSSSGSACAAGSDEASHVLVAMGVAPRGRADRGALLVPARSARAAGCRRRCGRGIRGGRTIGQMTRPAVTVIVPGYDVAPYAAEALASLQRADPRGLGRHPRRRRVDG